MRATVIDHVIVHGMTMAEAGLRVRPNLSRFTVATIIRAFRQHNRVERMPHRGGRVAIFTAAQETLIVDMVRENNLIRLWEIRDKVIADNVNFESIDDVSLATIDRVFRRQKMQMKQVYRVPFERNSTQHKDEYVQRMLQLARPHEYLFLDEAGFNLQKRRQRGCNVGPRAIMRFLANGGVILLFVRHGFGGACSPVCCPWVLKHPTFTTNSNQFLNISATLLPFPEPYRGDGRFETTIH